MMRLPSAVDMTMEVSSKLSTPSTPDTVSRFRLSRTIRCAAPPVWGLFRRRTYHPILSRDVILAMYMAGRREVCGGKEEGTKLSKGVPFDSFQKEEVFEMPLENSRIFFVEACFFSVIL